MSNYTRIINQALEIRMLIIRSNSECTYVYSEYFRINNVIIFLEQSYPLCVTDVPC